MRGAPKGNTNAQKGKVWNDALIRAIASDHGARVLKAAHRLLDDAANGEPWAIKELADRLDGKPQQESVIESISSVFSYAIKEWGIPLAVNPARLVSRPKGSDKRREKRWTDEQIKLILEVSQWQEGRYPRCPQEFVGWAFQVALETAMRLGEICSLSVKDFNEKERYVYLAKTKNGDERYVPLSSKALQYFKFLTSGKEGDHLIFPPSGSLGLYFREFRDAVGLRGLVFHDMRHEAATRLSKKFSNVLELSAMTGHRSLQSLKRYYNPTPAEIGARLD
jgi:integrase